MKPFGDVLISTLRNRALSVFVIAYLGLSAVLVAAHIVYFSWRISNQAQTVLQTAEREVKVSDQPSTHLKTLVRSVCGFANCSQLFVVDASKQRVLIAQPDEYDAGATALSSSSGLLIEAGAFSISSNGSILFEKNLDMLRLLIAIPLSSVFVIPAILVIILAASGFGFLVAARKSAHSVADILGREIALLANATTNEGPTPRFLTLEGEKIFGILVDQEKRIIEISKQVVENEKAREAAALAQQVAHDIRSPLSALDMALYDLNDFPEDKRILVRSATQRIRDISNNLIGKKAAGKTSFAKAQEPTQAIRIQLLSDVLESIVSEKRTQYRSVTGLDIDLQFSEKSYGLFAAIDLTEMKRLISNLINNSAEAVGEKGKIRVFLDLGDPGTAKITVADNGCGIPPEILPRLGHRGATFGKSNSESGCGLGLYHARTHVEAWGGTFSIESQAGLSGTQVVLTLPAAEAPRWFVKSVGVPRNSKVAVIDDDASIHHVWSGRFEASATGAKLCHFSSPLEFEHWANENAADIYLFDFELLGSNQTGLDIIEAHKLAHKAILVTSHFEETEVQDRCEALGVGLLPKGLASLVPVNVQEIKRLRRPDAILIDNDPLVKMTWELAAKERNKILLHFFDIDEFLKIADELDPDSPIFIDVNLADGVRGESVADRVHSLGFKDISLATGYENESLQAPAFIRKVVGKDPQF